MARRTLRAQLSEKTFAISTLQSIPSEHVSSHGLGFFQVGEPLIRKRPGSYVVDRTAPDLKIDNYLLCLDHDSEFDSRWQQPLRHSEWMGAWILSTTSSKPTASDERILDFVLAALDEHSSLSSSKIDPNNAVAAFRLVLEQAREKLGVECFSAIFMHPSILCAVHLGAAHSLYYEEGQHESGRLLRLSAGMPTDLLEPRGVRLADDGEVLVVTKKLERTNWQVVK